jgi:hypothetical protein
VPSWVDIAASDIDAGSKADVTLFSNLKTRDDAATENVHQVYFVSTGQSGNTYTTYGATLITRREYVPKSAKFFRLTLYLKASAGTAYVKATLGGIACVAEQSTVSATDVEKTLTWSDVSSLRGTTVNLLISVSNSAGGNTTTIRSDDIIAAVYSYD